MMIKLVVSSFFAWCLFYIASTNIGYITLKHEKIEMSANFANLFYSFFAWAFIFVLLKSFYELFIGILKPKFIKVNSKGVLIPKKVNSNINVMIKFNDMQSCIVDDKDITIHSNKRKFKISTEFLKDEYEFNKLSSLIYSEYNRVRKVDETV